MRSSPSSAAPSGDHWFGVNDQFYDVLSRVHLGCSHRAARGGALGGPLRRDRCPARCGVRLHRRLAGPAPRLRDGCALRLPLAAAGDRLRLLAARPVGRRSRRGSAVAHGDLHPAVLPRGAQHDGLGQGGDLRRGGPGDRRQERHDHAPLPVRQRHPVGARHRHPQRRRRDGNPGRARVPRAGDPAQRGCGVGLRPQPGTRRPVRRLVDGLLPRHGDRVADHRSDPDRRGPQRDDQPDAAQAAAAQGRPAARDVATALVEGESR